VAANRSVELREDGQSFRRTLPVAGRAGRDRLRTCPGGGRREIDRVDRREDELWFGKKPGWLGFGPLTWRGRVATFTYLFLLVIAVVTYSQLTLTALVIVFYTVVFGFVVVAKSDIMKDQHPPDP